MNLNLKGKKALITGGSKGIGLAIKKALEKEGVKVISWSRSEGVDLEDDNAPYLLPIDILINNFGGGGTWEEEDYWKVMHRNYGITLDLTRQFLKRWNDRKKKNKYGRVITISSIYGKEKGHNPGFTAAKSAQIAYMKSMAGKYEGVTFNTICPGYINTKPEIHKYAKKYLISAIGEPEDVANIVTFLCSEKAKFINGACITCDGGVSHSF